MTLLKRTIITPWGERILGARRVLAYGGYRVGSLKVDSVAICKAASTKSDSHIEKFRRNSQPTAGRLLPE